MTTNSDLVHRSWDDIVPSYAVTRDEMTYDPSRVNEEYRDISERSLASSFDTYSLPGSFQSDGLHAHMLDMPTILSGLSRISDTITTHSATVTINTMDNSRLAILHDGVLSDGVNEVLVRNGRVVNGTSSGPYFTGSMTPQSLIVDDVEDDLEDEEDAICDLREELSMRIEEVDEDLRARVEELESILQEQKTRISDLSTQLSHILADMRSMMDRLRPILRQQEEEDYRRQVELQRQRMTATQFISPEHISQMRFDPNFPE